MTYFDKLRPFTKIGFCDCASIKRLLLVYTLTDNPIHCFDCKGVVDPQTLALGEEQVDRVASWHGQFGALYDLWLDSGEYEAWAKAQLLNPQGQVNRSGLAAASALSRTVPTYYWWFHDEDDDVPPACPSCQGEVQSATRHGHCQCEACRIVV